MSLKIKRLIVRCFNKFQKIKYEIKVKPIDKTNVLNAPSKEMWLYEDILI